MGKFGKSRLRKGISIVAAMVLLLNTVLPTVPVFARNPESDDYEITLADFDVDNPRVISPEGHAVTVEDQTQTYEEYMEEHTQILDRSESESKEADKWIFIDHTNYVKVAHTWLADYYTNYEAEAWQDGINDPAFAWGAVHQNTGCANGSNGCVDGHVMPWTPSKFPWLFINHNFDGNTEVVISYNGAVVLSGWFPSSQIEKYNLAGESAGSVDRTYGFVSVPEELNLGTAETAEGTAHGLDLSKFEVKLVPNITESDWKADNPDRTISFADGVTPTDLSFKKDANNKIVLQQPAANPTKDGYTCNGWTAEGYTFGKPITGDITLDVNCTANVYEITWNYKTAEGVDTSVTSTGAYQEMPTHANPEPYVNTTDHRVYTFSGWMPELTGITDDAVYTAEYTAGDCDTGNRYHDISGTCVIASRVDWEWTTPTSTVPEHDTTRVASGNSPVLPDSFSGYESFISGSMIYTVTGWKSIIEGKVVYNLSEEVVDGKVYSYRAIYEPTGCASGYHFNGSGECVDTYTVTYTFDGDVPDGVNPPDAQDYKPGDTIITGLVAGVPGYTFGGWTNVPATMPDEDVTITGAWTINQYTIGFDSDEGTAVDSITEDYNTSINAPTEPTKTGYTFTGWYNGEEKVEFPVNMPVDGLNLKAHWDINQYTIGFDSDGGTDVDSITDDYDKSIAAPTEPTKTGYTFTGWYNGEEKVEFPVNMPVDGLNLKAHWDINQYTIGFDSDGGTAVDSITEDYNTSIVAPTEPTKTGYTFTGWYNGEEKVEFPVNMPVDGLNLKAHWDINEYEVTWNYKDSGGNDVTETGAVAYSQSPSHGNPATYEKNGKIYTFTGWTKEGVEGIVTLADEVITGEVTYTATYDEKSKPSGSSGGGGGGSSKTSASDEIKATTSDNAKDDSKTDDETKANENGEENANEGENKDEDKVAPMTEAQAVAKFGQEQIDAYKWALENGITTMKTVEDARLDEPLTRAELAKMMVVYVQKVLKKDPIVTGDINYPDVKVEEIGDLVDYIKLAYQYQIMGINADGTPIELFNPHGIVSRGEYATVFSRVLFGAKFNKSGEDFYTNHLEALKTAGILTNTLPSIQEMRGWVMLMMYRSSQNGEAIEKVVTATEENKDETKAEETTNAESTTGGTVETPTIEEKSETTVENTETTAESTTGDVTEINTGVVAEVATGDAASN